MDIRFEPLYLVEEQALLSLMNTPEVAAYLPLLTLPFTAENCKALLAAKKALWDTHGFGPWAIYIGGKFAGWGGLQPEGPNGEEADFALVLHPNFWGWGLKIFRKTVAEAFGPMGRTSLTALLPPHRPNSKAILRFGFTPEGQVTLGGNTFLKFRLTK